MAILFTAARLMLFSILVASAIALQACTLHPSPSAPVFPTHPPSSTRSLAVSVVSLTPTDSGKTIQIHPGDTFAVQLPENPTTGYRWAIQTLDDRVLELQTSEYSLSANAGMGGGGQHLFTFRAKAAGTTNLQLKEWRDWEGDASITQRFNVTVQVN
ncbi:MAG TPA: protease inhibitor I42 family protein [Coleofasciculaceae cyanobacterium]